MRVLSLLTMICRGNTAQERWQDFSALAPRVNSFVERLTITLENLNAILLEQKQTGAWRKDCNFFGQDSKEMGMNQTLVS